MKIWFRLAAVLALALAFSGCSKCSKKATAPAPTSTSGGEPVKTPNYNGITVTNVVKMELAPGKGKVDVAAGSTVQVKYTEWVYDPAALANQGPKIYEAVQAPREFKIGEGKVIKGFENGLMGAKAGSKRRLIIPAAEAYGDAGQPPKIPPKAMVMIEAEVISVD